MYRNTGDNAIDCGTSTGPTGLGIPDIPFKALRVPVDGNSSFKFNWRLNVSDLPRLFTNSPFYSLLVSSISNSRYPALTQCLLVKPLFTDTDLSMPRPAKPVNL
jgi:hypothetical protein